MEKNGEIKDSPYAGESFILTTKHAKSNAIAPPIMKRLGARVVEFKADTDELGTFSGEVERKGSPLECAKKKCEWSLQQYNQTIEFALASEGSFGPHPMIPFIACDHEILYFIDKRHDFHFHLSLMSTKTNYAIESINSWEKLQRFAHTSQFPSHALILRPDTNDAKAPIFKGIASKEDLKAAFFEALQHSTSGFVRAETDMRAHVNPSRMEVIEELANMLAYRLASQCPYCNCPGWGIIRQEQGLPCSQCSLETEMIKSEVLGCIKCKYEEIKKRQDNQEMAGPENCHYCNP